MASIFRFLVALLAVFSVARAGLPSARPSPSQRRFVSKAVDSTIATLAPKLKNADLAALFSNALPNTLDTTVQAFDAQAPSTFIITGDILAMWQRDSTNQVLPYLRFAKQDASLQQLFRGLIARQVANLLTDPHANAFKYSAASMPSPHTDDSTTKPSFLGTSIDGMGPLIFERKYELDSLVHVLKLGVEYYAATGDTAPYTEQWVDAVALALDTMRAQQVGTAEGDTGYRFQRNTGQPTDTLSHGVGTPVRRTGMIRSAFRPSDDATTYQFNVPGNAFAAVYLNRTASLLKAVGETDLASSALALAEEVSAGLRAHGVVTHPTHGQVYAYEVDGFGNALFMDDANLPSLLSLPYLGWATADDPLYLRTRALVLSDANPYWFNGSAASGIGGPHNGFGYIWPMSLTMQALTSTSDAEIQNVLDTLVQASAGTGFVHESFWKDDFGSYTRPWFAWANSLFGDLILSLHETRPHLLYR